MSDDAMNYIMIRLKELDVDELCSICDNNIMVDIDDDTYMLISLHLAGKQKSRLAVFVEFVTRVEFAANEYVKKRAGADGVAFYICGFENVERSLTGLSPHSSYLDIGNMHLLDRKIQSIYAVSRQVNDKTLSEIVDMISEIANHNLMGLGHNIIYLPFFLNLFEMCNYKKKLITLYRNLLVGSSLMNVEEYDRFLRTYCER